MNKITLDQLEEALDHVHIWYRKDSDRMAAERGIPLHPEQAAEDIWTYVEDHFPVTRKIRDWFR
jgi:hypothetical protein